MVLYRKFRLRLQKVGRGLRKWSRRFLAEARHEKLLLFLFCCTIAVELDGMSIMILAGPRSWTILVILGMLFIPLTLVVVPVPRRDTVICKELTP